MDMDIRERAGRICYLTGFQFFGLGANPDWREQDALELVPKLGQAIENIRPSEGAGRDNRDLVALASSVEQICRTQQKYIRHVRGQLRSVFKDYNSPDHLFNAACVLDMVREQCPVLLHNIPPVLGSAVESVEVFKLDSLRFDQLIRIFSNVCRQTGHHRTSLEALTSLLVTTRGLEEGAIFGELGYHTGTGDPRLLELIAKAYEIRSIQETKSGRADHAQSWVNRHHAIQTWIAALNPAA